MRERGQLPWTQPAPVRQDHLEQIVVDAAAEPVTDQMILDPIHIEDTPTVSCPTAGFDRGGLTGAGNTSGDDHAPATVLDALVD